MLEPDLPKNVVFGTNGGAFGVTARAPPALHTHAPATLIDPNNLPLPTIAASHVAHMPVASELPGAAGSTGTTPASITSLTSGFVQPDAELQ